MNLHILRDVKNCANAHNRYEDIKSIFGITFSLTFNFLFVQPTRAKFFITGGMILEILKMFKKHLHL